MVRLTVKELPKLKPGMHADGHGLYMNVKPSGARSWIFRAAINGRRREIGLGGFPVVNLPDARDAAINMQRQLRAGIDPLAERASRQRTSTTFEDIARALHFEKVKTWRNGKHSDQWINTLQTYAFPKLPPFLNFPILGLKRHFALFPENLRCPFPSASSISAQKASEGETN